MSTSSTSISAWCRIDAEHGADRREKQNRRSTVERTASPRRFQLWEQLVGCPPSSEVETMKRLLCGVAFAALIAAPVWAQTPNNNQNNPSNPNAGNPPATAQAPAQNAPAAGEK